MLGKLFDKVASGYAIRRLNESPTIKRAKAVIDEYWDGRNEISKDFSQKTIDEERAFLMEEAIAIATSSSSVLTNRQKLANSVVELATYQVLVLEPAPTPDPTRLRGNRGITGELRSRLVELAEKEKFLREFMHAYPPVTSWDDVWNPVLLRYRVTWARARLHEELRYVLDDTNPTQENDWYAPFLVATCAYQEAQFRKAIGMPSALADDEMSAFVEETKLFAFARFVNAGARFPDLEVQQMIREVEANTVFHD